MNTVDMTPTFFEAVEMCLIVLERGSEDGKRLARDELRRYGRELDRLKAISGTSADPADTPVEG